ncbi:hypothetical protein [Mycolicibacterium confluentis]|uniref:hypothetical protein n=1 Tax=Mycolicibacterium confluentis TaxID=28047 RepID=UPI000D6B951B|nr:hypothetical protein [Mycolicibacterium confluentis]MCV7322645.1 hypothetical protein [Mycolicibacterium confluentis]
MKFTAGVAATVAAGLVCAALAPAAWADPGSEPTTEPVPVGQTTPEDSLRNVTYRARVDGVSRGALITYKINDTQVQSVDPTMVPGRVFEAQTVLSDANLAGMQISIQWPYSANLHCEILVDDQIVAQADQWIKPRLTPANDDPDYGKLICGAPLVSPTDFGTGDAPAPDPAAEPAPEAPPAT